MKRILVLALFLHFLSTGNVFAEPVKIPHPESFTQLKKDAEDFKAIKKLFNDLVASAARGNIDEIMAFFSKDYLNSGRNRVDVKKQWEAIIKHFSGLELSHPIYQIEISGAIAKIHCQGTISGAPRIEGIAEPNQEIVTIDAWSFASHNVIKENGNWKILGDQIPFDTGRAFHPLF